MGNTERKEEGKPKQTHKKQKTVEKQTRPSGLQSSPLMTTSQYHG
jgi:hypothetical protein